MKRLFAVFIGVDGNPALNTQADLRAAEEQGRHEQCVKRKLSGPATTEMYVRRPTFRFMPAYVRPICDCGGKELLTTLTMGRRCEPIVGWAAEIATT